MPPIAKALRPHSRVTVLALAAVGAALVTSSSISTASATPAPSAKPIASIASPASPASPASSSPDYTGAPGSIVSRIPGRTTTATAPGTGRARAAAKPASAAATTDPVSLTTECPVGTKRGATLYADGFEKGSIPEPESSTGWTIGTSDPAEGTKYATSTIDAGAVIDVANPTRLSAPIVTRPSGTIVLDFAIRGTYPQDAAYVRINDANGWIDPSPTWGQVTLDVTKAVASDSLIDLEFFNYPQSTAAASVMDIDDVSLYVCSPVIATNVRGDFTGDYVADLAAVSTGGSLYIVPGKGNGTFGTPIRVGSGWDTTTWIGSPGDVTGDKRPDLLVRRSDGSMWLYPGRGMQYFGKATQIGRAWGAMTAIVTPGEMTGDSRQEILARAADGTLYRYSLAVGGTSIGSRVQVGTRVRGLLTSFGDLDSNKRGDLLALRSGTLYISKATTSGMLSPAVAVGAGWGVYDTIVGVGDLNKNGVGDLLGRKPDGSLMMYGGNGRGGFALAIAAGTGYSQYRLLG